MRLDRTAAALALAAATALAAACAAPTNDPGPSSRVEPNAGPVATAPVSETFQYYRYSSGVTEPARRVVADAGAWGALWAEIVKNHGPKPPAPAVDFAKEMVLFAAMGTRASGGYTIRIDSVSVADGRLRVVVLEVSPGPTCGTTAALTQPVDAVRVPRTDLPVAFVERKTVSDCG